MSTLDTAQKRHVQTRVKEIQALLFKKVEEKIEKETKPKKLSKQQLKAKKEHLIKHNRVLGWDSDLEVSIVKPCKEIKLTDTIDSLVDWDRVLEETETVVDEEKVKAEKEKVRKACVKVLDEAMLGDAAKAKALLDELESQV